MGSEDIVEGLKRNGHATYREDEGYVNDVSVEYQTTRLLRRGRLHGVALTSLGGESYQRDPLVWPCLAVNIQMWRQQGSWYRVKGIQPSVSDQR